MPSNEEIVAQLVTKLIADTTQYVQGMAKAAEEARKTAEEVEKNSKKVESFGDQLKKYVKGALEVLAVEKIKAYFTEALDVYKDSETGILRLNAAIEAHGGNVAETTAKYNKFATSIKNSTMYSAGEVKELLTMAEAYGLTGAKAERAAKNAIALSAVRGVSAESALRMTAALEEGNTDLLHRQIFELKDLHNETEKVALAQATLAKWYKVAEAEGNTTAGTIKRYESALKGFKKEAGAVIAEFIKPWIEMLAKASKGFSELNPNVKRFIIITLAAIVVAVMFWAAMNAGAALFNMLTGGVLIVIGAIIAGAVLVGVWASQFEDLGKAFEAVEKFVKGIIDNWRLFLPHIAVLVKIFQILAPIIEKIWEDISKGGAEAWDSIKQDIREVEEELHNLDKALDELGKEVLPHIGDAAKFVFRQMVDNLKVAIGLIYVATVATYNLSYAIGKVHGLDLSVGGIKQFINELTYTVKFIQFFVRYSKDGFDLIGAYIVYKMVYIQRWLRWIFVSWGPAFIKYFGEQAKSVFLQVGEFIREVFFNLLLALAKSIENLPEIIKDPKKLNEIWKDVIPPEGLKIKIAEFEEPPPLNLSALERRLKAEFEALERAFILGFVDFMREPWWKRLMDGMKADTKEVGEGIAEGMKDAVKEAEKFDAALLRSAETVTRIQNYRDSLKNMWIKEKDIQGGDAGGGGLPGVGGRVGAAVDFRNQQQLQPQPIFVMQNQNDKKEQNDLLRNIRDGILAQNTGNVVRIEFAELS